MNLKKLELILKKHWNQKIMIFDKPLSLTTDNVKIFLKTHPAKKYYERGFNK